HGAVGGSRHAAVADAHHVAHALFEQLGRQRHVGDLGHAGVALGAAAAQDQHGVGVDVQVGVVDALAEVVDGVEDQCPPAVGEQVRGSGGGLDERAVRGQVPAQQGD